MRTVRVRRLVACSVDGERVEVNRCAPAHVGRMCDAGPRMRRNSALLYTTSSLSSACGSWLAVRGVSSQGARGVSTSNSRVWLMTPGHRFLLSMAAQNMHPNLGPALDASWCIVLLTISRTNRRRMPAPASAETADFHRPACPVATQQTPGRGTSADLVDSRPW